MFLLAFYLALFLSAAYYLLRRRLPSKKPLLVEQKPLKNIMQAPNADLKPPKDDPFTLEQLKAFDGSDPSKPIYVAIKGAVFDVSHKQDIYGPGKSYSIFAGKDGSKGLGMSSLKPEHAVPDYRDLSETDMKVLNDWHGFFSKRYNIVGRVIDHPVQDT
jgi:membrane-associated progesterone receptor component